MAKDYLLSYEMLMKNGVPYGDSVSLIRQLVKENHRFLILTDNVFSSKQRISERMYEAGFPLLSEDLFYTSLDAAMDIIINRYPDKRHLFVIGNRSIQESIQSHKVFINEAPYDWVILGPDRKADYSQYNEAMNHLMNGANLIVLNDDPVSVSEKGKELGIGAIALALEQASRKKRQSLSWNSSLLIQCALLYFHSSIDQAILISDRLKPDIETAYECGLETAYLLPDRETDLSEIRIRPTYIIDSLSGLLR